MALLPYFNSANNDYLNTGQLWAADKTIFCRVKIADVAQEGYPRIINNATSSHSTEQGLCLNFNGDISSTAKQIAMFVNAGGSTSIDYSTSTYGRGDLLFIALSFENSTKRTRGYIIKNGVVDVGINYIYGGTFNFNGGLPIEIMKMKSSTGSGLTGWLYNAGIANTVLSQAQIESISQQCENGLLPSLDGVTFTLNRRAITTSPYTDEGDGLGVLSVQYTSTTTIEEINSEGELVMDGNSETVAVVNSEGELIMDGISECAAVVNSEGELVMDGEATLKDPIVIDVPVDFTTPSYALPAFCRDQHINIVQQQSKLISI